MLKKIFLILILTSLIVIAEDSLDNLNNIPRCIINNKCEYFETVESCYQDCNINALQKQMEIELNSRNSETKITVDTNSNLDKKNTYVYSFISVIFIIFVLVFVIGLYYWSRKNDIKPEINIKKKNPVKEKVELKQNYDINLPRRPIRRL